MRPRCTNMDFWFPSGNDNSKAVLKVSSCYTAIALSCFTASSCKEIAICTTLRCRINSF